MHPNISPLEVFLRAGKPSKLLRAGKPGKLLRAGTPGKHLRAGTPGKLLRAGTPGKLLRAGKPLEGRQTWQLFKAGKVFRAGLGLGLQILHQQVVIIHLLEVHITI